MTPTAELAWLALANALDDLAGRGRRTPCQVAPAAFVSHEREDRQRAEVWCLACPVLAYCLTYADTADEPAGVWGGVDRAPGAGGHRAARRRVQAHLARQETPA